MLYEPERSFAIPLGAAELFTSVPRWKEFIDTDELTLQQCTAGFYLASRRMDRIVAKFPEVDPVPTHLFVAGDEGIIENEKTLNFIGELSEKHTRITTYDGLRHSLEVEGDPEVYFADLISFIQKAS